MEDALLRRLSTGAALPATTLAVTLSGPPVVARAASGSPRPGGGLGVPVGGLSIAVTPLTWPVK